MADDIIDSQTHADLIAKQQAVFAAFEAIETHTRDVAKPTLEWTDVDKVGAEELREAARQTVVDKGQALAASGLIEDYGSHRAGQALKQAARMYASEQGPA